MPKKLERKLFRTVNRKHPNFSKKRKNAYVYGTLQNIKKRAKIKRRK